MGLRANRELAFVDHAAVGDFNYQDRQSVLFDAAENPVVSDAIAPQARKLVEQWLAEVPRVRCARNALMQVTEDAALDRPVKFGKIAVGSIAELNLPGHTSGQSPGG